MVFTRIYMFISVVFSGQRIVLYLYCLSSVSFYLFDFAVKLYVVLVGNPPLLIYDSCL